jgi:hypothetical protein
MRQKTKNYRIKGSNAKFFFLFFNFPSHIPIWVWFVQKTRAKNSHAWAPLKIDDLSEAPNPLIPPPCYTLYEYIPLYLFTLAQMALASLAAISGHEKSLDFKGPPIPMAL